MMYNKDWTSIRSMVITIVVISNVIILKTAFIGNESHYWLLCVTIPLLVFVLRRGKRRRQGKIYSDHVAGRSPYAFTSIRHELQNYFFRSGQAGSSSYAGSQIKGNKQKALKDLSH